jgi:hypothetical protein
VLIDLIEGNRAIDVSRCLSGKDREFLGQIRTVVCDPHEGCRQAPLHPTSTTPPKGLQQLPPTRAVALRRGQVK